MLNIRLATVEDAEVITHHRRRMFVDAGEADESALDRMAGNFEPWVEERLAKGSYLGWLAADEDKIAGGAGLLLLDWPPNPLDPEGALRGYLLNVYVEPEYRRQGVATLLIEQTLAEARARSILVVALHATEVGRKLYENHGFRSTNEMFHTDPPAQQG